MSEADTQVEPVAPASRASEELYLGDAIHFFLNAKRASGRSERTIDDYRKKLELLQRWVAARYGGEDSEEVDAPYLYIGAIGADEVESYVVYLRDERAMADSSRKNHLAVLRSFFQTLSRRLEVPDPPGRSTRCASTRVPPREATSPGARPISCSPPWISK
jgi:site-specific recombinase XerD